MPMNLEIAIQHAEKCIQCLNVTESVVNLALDTMNHWLTENAFEEVTVPDYPLGTEMVFGLLGVISLWVVRIVFRFRQQGSKSMKFPQLAEGVTIFITSAAIYAGLKVCFLAFDPNILSLLRNDIVYIFLGGMAVVWVSMEATINHLFK